VLERSLANPLGQLAAETRGKGFVLGVLAFENGLSKCSLVWADRASFVVFQV
jgi:hypothetical protein